MLEFTHVTQNPDLLGGKPCIRHLPITVGTLLSLIAEGRSLNEIVQLYPALRVEDIRDALRYAAWRIEEPGPVAPPVHRADKLTVKKGKDASAPTEISPTGSKKQAPLQLHDQNRPCIVMTRAGLFDRRLGIGVIAWQDIHKISIEKRGNAEFVFLEIPKPYPYLQQLPEFKRRWTELLMFFGISPFNLSATGTGLSTADLFGHIWRVWTVYRNDSWHPPSEIPEFDVTHQDPGTAC